jgi:hypothetical protein
MKTKTFLLLALFVALAAGAFAGVLTVSNNSNSPGQYTSLQTAIDAAAIGDTIMVAGSATSYGNISIGKKLMLVGAGYHNPYGNSTTIGNIELYRTNLYIAASGSKLIGLIFNQASMYGNFNGGSGSNQIISGVVIERCWFNIVRFFSWSDWSTCKNDTIRNCFINNRIGDGYQISLEDIYIHNNVFNGGGVVFNYGNISINSIYIRNNIFLARNNNCFQGYCQNMIIENNIFYAASPQGASNSVYTKNLTFMCLDNAIPGAGNFGSGNIINQNPLFVNYPLAGGVGFDWSYDFHLQPNSPAKNAGTDGTDLGIYGGWAPFEVGANPYFPQMMELTLPNGSSVPAGGTLNVHFKARKQN